LTFGAGVACAASLAGADVINFVGYQYGPAGSGVNTFPNVASWHDAGQWFGFVVPDANDVAVFDATFDPQGNGMPSTIVLRDFTIPADPPSVPNPVFVPGGDVVVDHIVIRDGGYTVDGAKLSPGQHRLEATTSLRVEAIDSAGFLTLSSIDAITGYFNASGSNGNVGSLALRETQLTLPGNSLFDVGTLGRRGLVELVSRPGDVEPTTLAAGYGRIGENGGSSGTLRLIGERSEATFQGMQIGATGLGTVEVLDGRLTSTSFITLGNFSDGSAEGHLLVDGNTAGVYSAGLTIGDSGTGTVEVRNLASMGLTEPLTLGVFTESSGELTVTNGAVVGTRLEIGRLGHGRVTLGTGAFLDISGETLVAAVAAADGPVIDAFYGSGDFRMTGGYASCGWNLYIGGHPSGGQGGDGYVELENTSELHAANVLFWPGRGGNSPPITIGPEASVVLGVFGPNDPVAGTPGAVVVGPQARFQGAGEVRGRIIVDAGVLAPGHPVGRMDSPDGVVIRPGGVAEFDFSVAGFGARDQIVGGPTQLDGGTLVLRFAPHPGLKPPTTVTTYRLISGGPASGDFDSVVFEGIEPTFFEKIIDSTGVTIRIAQCLADRNGDGVGDSSDVELFIQAFLTTDPAADVDRDGQIDSGDLQAFIVAFIDGCGQ
jgi:hypothetical protein